MGIVVGMARKRIARGLSMIVDGCRRRVIKTQQREFVTIEAVVGYDDAVERWMAALDVLAEYGRRAEDKEDDA